MNIEAEDGRVSVLHFSNSLVRGGAEEHMLALLQRLDRRSFRVHLMCTPTALPLIRPDIPEDVEVFPLRIAGPRDVVAAVKLATVLRSRKIDVLHSHMFCASLFASPIGWACRVPLVVETPHIRESWRHGWKAWYWIDRLVGRCVDQYICVSEANRQYLIETKGLPACKMNVIYSGVDLQRFDPCHQPVASARRSLGFRDDDPVLLLIGRLEPQKGHEIMLAAMQQILQTHPTVRLVCVGEGALSEQLQEKTSGLGLSDSVRFVGYQSNPADWYAISTITVLPSFFEGLPLTCIESLASGRTMVASAVDGTPEVIIDGETGLTVPPGDPAALARAVCSLLDDTERRDRFARAGRKLVLDRFGFGRFVEQTEQLYLRAASAPKPLQAFPAAS